MTDRPRSPRRRRFRGTWLLLLALCSAALAWSGTAARVLSALLPLNLADGDAWFIDMRLKAISSDRAQCTAMLQSHVIDAVLIDDKPFVDGCGWRNAVRFKSAASTRLPVDSLTCEAAAATALWLAHVVQPAAQERLGQKVTAVQLLGGYACRNIVGNPMWRDFRSQHATANAIDVSSFTLGDGRRLSVKSSWHSRTPEGEFLRDVHKGACRYFRAVLGPDYNAAHVDHFHLDRGYITSCK